MSTRRSPSAPSPWCSASSASISPKIVVAHAGLGDEARIVARDVEIDEKQRLLDLVDDQAEQARVLEHAPEQPEALVAPHLEEALDRAAHPVPAGDDVAVLRPGEHPRNGAQIAQRARAEAPRRARADIEQRDLLERARRLEIGDEVGMADEARIGGARSAGQRLQGVVELARWAAAPPRAPISAHARTRSRRAAPSDRAPCRDWHI